ncbi:MAG TPA: hypothetical protein VKU40_15240, partial [Thermoanaerobaculia bacterium]|nr:hypothetical protein [Thermoanaerobaculia bacterium]
MAGDGTHGLDAALAAALRAAGPPGEVIHDVDARTLRLAAPAATVVVPDRRQPDAEATAEAVGRLVAEPVPESADPSVGPVVLVASSEVYEPSHHHPGMIVETALNLRPGANPVARRWLEVEEAARERAEAAGRPLAVLRAAPVPRAGGDDWASDLLTRRWAPTLPGHDPVMQLLALPDLAAAVLAAARHVERHGEAGTWNVVPAEVVPLRWALRLAGTRRLPAPAFVHRLLGRPWREPAERLAYLTYPWTASGDAARSDLGFTARHTSAEAVTALAAGSLEPPRVGLSFDDFGLSPDYIA